MNICSFQTGGVQTSLSDHSIAFGKDENMKKFRKLILGAVTAAAAAVMSLGAVPDGVLPGFSVVASAEDPISLTQNTLPNLLRFETAAIYRLDEDIEITDNTLQIIDDVTFILNGHNITINQTNEQDAVQVYDNKSFVIQGTGNFTANALNTTYGNGIRCYGGASLTIENGPTVTFTSAAGGWYKGIVASNGTGQTLTIDNATVTNTTLDGSGFSNATITNSTISGSTVTGGTITGSTVTGGTIKSSTVTNSTVGGKVIAQAIYNENGKPSSGVIVNVSGGGTVSCGSKEVSDGNSLAIPANKSDEITLTLTPNSGNVIKSVEYGYTRSDDISHTGRKLPVSGNTATLTVPADLKDGTSVNLTVTFVSALAGGADEASAVALTDSAVTDLAGGWYKVDSDITFGHTLYLLGDTHLIIAEGKTMTVNTASNRGIDSEYTLTVSGKGALNVETTENYKIAVCVGSYEQTGATVTASGFIGIRCMDNFVGFDIPNNFTFSGGKLTATGSSAGVWVDNNITIDYTNADDFIRSSSYEVGYDSDSGEYGTVTIAEGKYFIDEYGYFYSGEQTLDLGIAKDLANKTLVPAYKVTLDMNYDGGEDIIKGVPASTGKVTAPTAPTREGYTFGGWYTTDACETAFDFANTVITEDTTIYAKWRKTLTADNVTIDDLTYNGEVQTDILTVKDGDVTLTAGTDYTVTYSPAEVKNAGEYTAAITGIGNYAGTVGKTFTVKRASITPTLIIQNKTYDGNEITYTIEDNPGSGTVTYLEWAKQNSDNTWSSFSDTPKDAGKYRGQATIAETDNYSGATTNTAEFTISKAAITPTVSIANRVYGTTASTPIVTGNPGNGAVTYTYSSDGENFSADVPTAVGNYTIKAVVAETENYLGGEATATFSITKAPATVTTAPTAVTGLRYDSAAHELVSGGEANGGTMVYSLTENGTYTEDIPTGTDAGIYVVWYKVIGDDNHSDSTAESLNVTIARKAVVVTADNKSRTISGEDPELTATVTGLVGSDTISYTLSREAGEDVGTYTITPSGDAEQGNYTVTYQTGIFTIADIYVDGEPVEGTFTDILKNAKGDKVVITLGKDVSISKLTFPKEKDAKEIIIDGNGYTIGFTGSASIKPNQKLTLVNVNIEAVKNGKPQTITITSSKYGLTLENIELNGKKETITASSGDLTLDNVKGNELTVKGAAKTTLTANGDVDATTVSGFGTVAVNDTLSVTKTLTVNELMFADNAVLKIAADAAATIKKGISGNGTISLASGFKPISISGALNGTIKLTGDKMTDGTLLFKTKLDLTGKVDISGIAPEVTDGEYKYDLYAKSGKVYLCAYRFTVDGTAYAVWADAMNAITKAKESGKIYAIELLGDIDLGKTFKLPTKGKYAGLTINGNGHTITFSGSSITLTGDLTLTDLTLNATAKKGCTIKPGKFTLDADGATLLNCTTK